MCPVSQGITSNSSQEVDLLCCSAHLVEYSPPPGSEMSFTSLSQHFPTPSRPCYVIRSESPRGVGRFYDSPLTAVNIILSCVLYLFDLIFNVLYCRCYMLPKVMFI